MPYHPPFIAGPSAIGVSNQVTTPQPTILVTDNNGDVLSSGEYLVNSGDGSFTVALDHNPLDVWIFEEPIPYSNVNSFSIGVTGETFVFEGQTVSAPFEVPFSETGRIRIIAANTDGEYVIEQDFSEGVTARVSKVERYQINQEELLSGPTSNGGAGSGMGPAVLSIGQIAIPAAGVYPVTHSATGIVNTAGMLIGSTPAEADDDIFSSTADRLTAAEPSKTYEVTFPAAGTYYISVFSGGGGSVDTHTVTVDGLTESAGTGLKVHVLTYEDNTQAAFLESDNSEIDISAGVPDGWELCAEPVTSSLFDLFNSMNLDNGALPPVASIFGEFPSVILEDAGSNTAHYGYTALLPLTEPQTVRLKLKRDIANGQTFLLRTTGAGTQELIIDLQTGDVNVSNGGAGVDPVVIFSHVDTDTITVVATFQPNAGISLWDFFPSAGPAGIVVVAAILVQHKAQWKSLILT